MKRIILFALVFLLLRPVVSEEERDPGPRGAIIEFAKGAGRTWGFGLGSGFKRGYAVFNCLYRPSDENTIPYSNFIRWESAPSGNWEKINTIDNGDISVNLRFFIPVLKDYLRVSGGAGFITRRRIAVYEDSVTSQIYSRLTYRQSFAAITGLVLKPLQNFSFSAEYHTDLGVLAGLQLYWALGRDRLEGRKTEPR